MVIKIIITIIIKMIIIAVIVMIIINGKLTMDIPLGGSSFPPEEPEDLSLVYCPLLLELRVFVLLHL